MAVTIKRVFQHRNDDKYFGHLRSSLFSMYVFTVTYSSTSTGILGRSLSFGCCTIHCPYTAAEDTCFTDAHGTCSHITQKIHDWASLTHMDTSLTEPYNSRIAFVVHGTVREEGSEGLMRPEIVLHAS